MTNIPRSRDREYRRGRPDRSDHEVGNQVQGFSMTVSMLDMTVAESSGPPAGLYRAEFQGVTQTTHAEYGEGALFTWKIVEGEHKGKIASRTCKPVPSAKNVTGKLVAGLVGGQLSGGQKVSLASCVGKVYTIVVGLAQNGTSTRVESCIAS